MPFMTPQHIGRKEGIAYLKEHPEITIRDTFIKEGREMSKQYREEASQGRYLQAWENVWFASKFTEEEIASILEDYYGSRPQVRAVRRYKTKNGYLALVFLFGKYQILFISSDGIQKPTYTSNAIKEWAAIEEIKAIADIIGAEVIIDIEQSE